MDNKINLAKDLGARVRSSREALGISQAELARRVNMTRSGICRIERGNNTTPISKLKIIASALDVDPMYLLLGASSEDPKSELTTAQSIIINYVKTASEDRLELLIKYIDLLEGGGR